MITNCVKTRNGLHFKHHLRGLKPRALQELGLKVIRNTKAKCICILPPSKQVNEYKTLVLQMGEDSAGNSDAKFKTVIGSREVKSRGPQLSPTVSNTASHKAGADHILKTSEVIQ